MSGGDSTPSGVLQATVVLEQTLGHVTHGKNLQRLLPQVPGFSPTFVPVPFDVDGWQARIPGYSNWTVRSGIRARLALRSLKSSSHDVMFVHTQVPAVLLGKPFGSLPTVVSLDATPKQYDSLGEHYAHAIGPEPVERAKAWLNQRCFTQADHLVSWTQWTKDSLVDDYGIEPDKVTVIPPGVDTERWLEPPSAEGSDTAHDDDVCRILFVGGDLERKGGHHLLAAFAELRKTHGESIELHLVTTSPVEQADGVTVYDSMTSNSPELIALYHRCHIFCLPTLGDCLPMVLAEAGAAGLALIATSVGAIGDIVRHEDTGLLVPVSDVPALVSALDRLISDPTLRSELAGKSTALVLKEHDAAANAARLVEVLRGVVDRRAANV